MTFDIVDAFYCGLCVVAFMAPILVPALVWAGLMTWLELRRDS